MPHIFTGSLPATRQPTKYGSAPAWYHIDCSHDSRSPCAVALDQATLMAGGGTRLYPGSAADLYGAGFYACAPLFGFLPIISVETRTAPTPITVDPRAQEGVIHSFKAHRMQLAPGVWRSFSTGILGMTRWKLRAFGGVVWVGTHVDTTKPPTIENPSQGDAWPIYPSDPPLDGAGNGDYYAWTNDPGVELVMVKLCGAYDFVVRPK